MAYSDQRAPSTRVVADHMGVIAPIVDLRSINVKSRSTLTEAVKRSTMYVQLPVMFREWWRDEAMASVGPEICNCTALRQAARHVTRLYDDALAPVGIGLNQFSVLARIDRVGPSTVQDLAQLLVMDRSTLGHLLRPLEERGLVKLRASKQDRRSRVVMLTAAGKALLARADPLWAGAQTRFESTFGERPALNLRLRLRRITTLDFDRGVIGYEGSP